MKNLAKLFMLVLSLYVLSACGTTSSGSLDDDSRVIKNSDVSVQEEEVQEQKQFTQVDALSLVVNTYYDGEALSLVPETLKEGTAYLITKFAGAGGQAIEEEYLVVEGEIIASRFENEWDEYVSLVELYSPSYFGEDKQPKEEVLEEKKPFTQVDALSLVANTYYDGEALGLIPETLKEGTAYLITKFAGAGGQAIEEEYLAVDGEIVSLRFESEWSEYVSLVELYSPGYFGELEYEVDLEGEDYEEETLYDESLTYISEITVSDVTVEHMYDTTYKVIFKLTNNINHDIFATVKVTSTDANGTALTSKETYADISANEYKFDYITIDTFGDPNVAEVRVDVIEISY